MGKITSKTQRLQLEEMLKKYIIYRSNIQWHIDTNKPIIGALYEQQIKIYTEVIEDLKKIVDKNETT